MAFAAALLVAAAAAGVFLLAPRGKPAEGSQAAAQQGKPAGKVAGGAGVVKPPPTVAPTVAEGQGPAGVEAPSVTPAVTSAAGGAGVAPEEPLPVRGAQRRLAEAIARGERVSPLFSRVSEGILAMYTEPGRGFIHHPLPENFEEDMRAALAEDITVEDTDTPDEERQKELVAWLKEDMRRHVAGGGTALGYMGLLREREGRDAEVYAEAQRLLGDLVRDGGTEGALAAHRALNAELEAAGIAPLPLPGRVRRELKAKGIEYGQ